MTSKVFFLLFFPFVLVNAQGYYPEMSGMFYGFEPQFNFSSISDSNRYMFNARHQAVIENVFKSSFFAGFLVGKNQSKHRFSFFVENQKQGPFLSAIYPVANYQFLLKITPKSSLSTAMSFAALNFAARLPNQTFDLIVPDMNWGVSFINPKAVIGFAVNQMIDNRKDGLWLRRYSVFNVQKTFELSHKLKTNGAIISRFFQDYPNDYRILGALDWNDMFSFGISYGVYGSSTFFAEPQFLWNKKTLAILIAYTHQMNVNSLSPANNRFEIGLKLSFQEKDVIGTDD